VIFTCDLYNEGVDLLFVDTLLLLRPTQSATLFLQQLGAGCAFMPARRAAWCSTSSANTARSSDSTR
jgi:hypothetical protein